MAGASKVVTQLSDLVVDVALSAPVRGDLIYRGALKWNNLHAGAAGNFLQSQGSGADPTWAALSPGGSSGQLQYNNAGSFGGASGLIVAADPVLAVTTQSTTGRGLTVRGITSQSGNLTEWYDSSGNLKAWVGPDGVASFAAMPVVSAVTQGSVLFGGVGGIVAQDNANFFWDATNHRLGIGTATPISYNAFSRFTVEGSDAASYGIQVHNTGTGQVFIALDNNVAGWKLGMLGSSGSVQLATSGGSAALSALNTLQVGIGAAPTTAQQLLIASRSLSTVGLAIKGAASQSVNLQEWQTSGGTPKLVVVPGAATLASPALSPTALAADQNDYAPGVARRYRLTTDGLGARNITGLSISQVDGQEFSVVNVGTDSVVLKHQSASSVAANRFICTGAADVTLAADEEALVWYDSTTARFRVRKV